MSWTKYQHCPWCHEYGGLLLGILGKLKWFRCRYCGGQFSKGRI